VNNSLHSHVSEWCDDDDDDDGLVIEESGVLYRQS
jgi:hypothetical protein